MQFGKKKFLQAAALILCLCGTVTALGETIPPYPDGCDNPNMTPAPPYWLENGWPEETCLPVEKTEEAGEAVPEVTPEAAIEAAYEESPDYWQAHNIRTPLPTLPPLPTAEPETSAYERLFGVTEEELVLAARVAYLEAGSKENGVRAVLSVIYNRCMAPRFGGEATTIETEVFRKGQFSVVHHKRFDKIEPPEEYVEIAREVFYEGKLYLPENILFFCARRLGKSWGGRKFYKDIGGNLFFYGRTE